MEELLVNYYRNASQKARESQSFQLKNQKKNHSFS